ncbi:MAG TPA: hypothetical protein VMU24_12115, partial [Candidatus Acidoferrales bacterium]|nr:hypothetical protein [Candidatus Acidoferrales bacterium]
MQKQKLTKKKVASKQVTGATTEKLSHYDAAGRAVMVDVSPKVESARTAEASAFVAMRPEVLRALPQNQKGNPFE